MTGHGARRLRRLVLGCALVVAAPTARAQDFTVALTPAAAPLSNGATQNHASSVYYDVTNSKANTNVTEVEFRLPSGYTAQGGLPPAGWTVSRIYTRGGRYRVHFRTADCTLPGASIVNGQTVTFRIDVTPPTTGISGDTTNYLLSVVPNNPCGSAGNWTLPGNNTIPLPRKVLWVTASAAPLSGASPLADTLGVTVKNESNVSKTGVTVPAPTVTASSGASYLAWGCTPVASPLAAGATSTITCSYTLTAAASGVSSFGFAATATGPTASALGAVAGPVLVGPATATFAFDNLAAGPGDDVQAILAVMNNTAGAMTITPPRFSQLTLVNVAKATGTSDPGAATVGAGATAQFIYGLTVTGVVSSQYTAAGTASTTSGNTNLAVTPPGTVAASRVDWLPEAIVKSRAGGVYRFTITVVNNSNVAVSEIDVINPQPGTWTGIANVSASGITYNRKTTSGGVDTLIYTGSLAAHGTATIVVGFTDIPTVTAATGSVDYTFQVKVIPARSGSRGVTYYQTVTDTWPIDDVAGLSLLSTPASQTLYWTNTTRTDTPHDGVVVFRATPPNVPGNPSDGTDYTTSPTPPANTTLVYADKDGSPVSSISDAPAGAYNYRVCNHDDNFVYSNCNSGFWNNAGWLDSAPAPAGGWSHTVGYQALLYPGIIPGGWVGFASNAPALTVLASADGQRPFDAVSLAAVPALGTPAATLSNARQIMFAADQGGTVTALDVLSGATYWQVTKAGESFVAGVGAALWRYALPAFQAVYANDVLFLGSTTGRLLALDATTGATLWSATAGTSIRALPSYDYARNWLYVPTDGGGILAFDLGTGQPPAAAAGWVNPGGAYRLGCSRADVAAQMTCVDRTGGIRVLDRATGATVATGAFTGGGTPSSAWKVPGGLVVGSASAVQTFTLSGATFTATGTFTLPGRTLSPVQVFGSTGFVYVGASDLRLHKLRLADASEVPPGVAVTSQLAGTLLGPASFDVTADLFFFGASDGRLWAVPYF
jgi:hypothetical protein